MSWMESWKNYRHKEQCQRGSLCMKLSALIKSSQFVLFLQGIASKILPLLVGAPLLGLVVLLHLPLPLPLRGLPPWFLSFPLPPVGVQILLVRVPLRLPPWAGLHSSLRHFRLEGGQRQGNKNLAICIVCESKFWLSPQLQNSVAFFCLGSTEDLESHMQSCSDIQCTVIFL